MWRYMLEIYPLATVQNEYVILRTELNQLIEAELCIYASVNYAIIGSDNGLSPGRRQAIIWTNAGILLIRTLETNFSEISSEIHTFSFTKIHLKMLSALNGGHLILASVC